MRNYFIFNEKSSADFEVWVSGIDTYRYPERDIEKVEVPGKSGDVVFDKKRYKNITIPYRSYISRDFSQNIDNLMSYLNAQSGYKRLEDTYHPDEYRMASYVGGVSTEVSVNYTSGNFRIEFDCKPQRWLKSGEREIEYLENGKIYNPTEFIALPCLRVYGIGTVSIGTQTITIKKSEGYVDIDCEIQDAYKDSTNCNDNITLTSGEFFSLLPGTNNVSLGTGITKILLKPRWYKI